MQFEKFLDAVVREKQVFVVRIVLFYRVDERHITLGDIVGFPRLNNDLGNDVSCVICIAID
jgi:hypothetical protein